MARFVSGRDSTPQLSHGTMTVTGWAPPNVLGFDICDGAGRITSLMHFDPGGDGRTKVTVSVDMHHLDDSMAEVVRPDDRGVHGQHGPSAGRGYVSGASRQTLGVRRHDVSSAPYLPG